MIYKLQSGLVQVKARSAVLPTVTRFARVEGTIDLDPDSPTARVQGEIRVDLRAFDAGDRFKNWKIGSELAAAEHPEAKLTLTRLEQTAETAPGRYRGHAHGQLRWRGHAADVRLKGQASVNRRSIEASGSFELDLRRVGIPSSSFRTFRDEDVVLVEVQLVARAVS